MNAPQRLAPEVVCPRCHGALTPHAMGSVRCQNCESLWPLASAIPDLRTNGDPFLSIEEDREAAARLTANAHRPFPEVLASYYDGNARVPASQARAIIGATLAASHRSRAFLTQAERLLAVHVGAAHHVLDIGAGTGPLSIELARTGARVWSTDVGLRWIALARVRARDAGVSLDSCCAGIEALPFPDASFDLVLGESVLELVKDQELALREICRVMRPGAFLVLATPNRWSPGPDPHLGIPFTSWLPQRAVNAIAGLRGILPPTRSLLSRSALRRLFELAGLRTAAIVAPELSERLGEGRPLWLRGGLAVFRWASSTRGLRAVTEAFSPVLIAAAQRPDAIAP